MYPGFGMPVPYQTSISPPITNGTQIHVSGTPTGNRFEINLKSPQDDFVLHFNPRFDDNALVMNTAQRGAWGTEDRKSLPFYRGTRFMMVIMVADPSFKIAVNNAHFCEFHQRLPSHLAQILEVKGDINLESVQIYPGAGSMGFPPPFGGSGFVQPPVLPGFGGNMNINFGFPSAPTFPPSFPMGGSVPSIQSCHLHPGSQIFIRGVISQGANRFEINLLQGFSDTDDIAFHFNPRFDSRTIVKNHRRGGQWGQEENQPFPYNMPLMPGSPVDLRFSCHPDKYTVFMNNIPIAEYYHKIPPGYVTAIQYKGDITVNSIGQI